MWLSALLFLVMATLGNADLGPTSSGYSPSSPSCTLTFTNTQPSQIGPTTTLFDAIMTTFLYGANCDVCTVTNIQEAHVQGPWSERTTVPTLTVTEVVCIPQGTASYRGQTGEIGQKFAVATPTAGHWYDRRGLQDFDLSARSDSEVAAALIDITDASSSDIPANVSFLSDGLKAQFTKVESVILALSIVDSGMNATQACQQLQTTEVAYNLLKSWYDGDTVKALVCWCAKYGYSFGITRESLYSALYAAIQGIFAAAGFTNDRGEICDSLGIFNQTGPPLGINTQEYHDLVCKDIPASTTSTPLWYGTTPIVPWVTSGYTTWGPPGTWEPNVTVSGTGYSTWTGTNVTVGPPVSYTGTIGTDWSVTGHPVSNWTQPTTEPAGTAPASDTPTGASNDSSPASRTPRGRNAMPFYPAIPTTTQRNGLFKRY